MTVAMMNPESACQPRWATKRTPGRPTVGPAIVEQARQLGWELMPWQIEAAYVAGELVPYERDPRLWVPAYRRVGITVPRQSGKTTFELSKMTQRARGWVDQWGPQRVSYSAQTGNDARKKLVEDWLPILGPRAKKLGISRILTGMGNEAVVFRNQSRIILLASTPEAGHGKTIDDATNDELFADKDDRRDQALVPAMATRPAAQTTSVSTMGTDESVPLNRLVEQGRAAVEAGERSGIAYFEYSADPDADPDDPRTWYSCMPALGFTIDESVVRHARSTLSDGEFRRAFLNQPTKADDRVISVPVWTAVCSPDVAPLSSVAFGVDMNPERSATSVAAASAGSIPVVELVAYIEGESPVARIARVAREHQASVVIDKASPANALVDPLEAAGVKVIVVGTADVVAATGDMYDRIVQARVSFRTDPLFDLAAAAATRRPVGDAWCWGRKRAQADVSPLIAATLAVRGATLDIGGEPFALILGGADAR